MQSRKASDALADMDERDELPVRDPLPPVDEDSHDYKAAFLAGTAGLPCSSTPPDWMGGWADAEE